VISFKKYYLQQFKDVPVIWKLAKKHRKYGAFISSVFLLLSPMAILTMWLYDTGLMEIDKSIVINASQYLTSARNYINQRKGADKNDSGTSDKRNSSMRKSD
jgi:hypothetical protein